MVGGGVGGVPVVLQEPVEGRLGLVVAGCSSAEFGGVQADEIGYDETTRQWSARFKGADYEMIGRTGDELRHAIRLDYQERRREEQMAYIHLRERSST